MHPHPKQTSIKSIISII